MKTQTDRLIEWLDHSPIDPLTEWTELGLYRLSARIHDARARGLDIKRASKTVRNRYGEKVTVALYYLYHAS